MPHRHDIAAAYKNMRLAKCDSSVNELRGAGNDKKRVPVQLELGVVVGFSLKSP